MHYVNDLKTIHNFLIMNGWIDLGYGCMEYLSKDYKFKIAIGYNQKDKFYVRSAILSTYDRWANSGAEDYFCTCDEVISFLNGRYILSAFDADVISILEDGYTDDGKMDEETYKLVLEIIDLLD